MEIRKQILKILETQPNLSSAEIGKLLGKHRSTIIYHLHKLNIYRDRNFIRKQNNNIRSYPIIISDTANQIILGSILGDGSITKNKRVNDSKLNCNSKLSIKHSLKQKEYVKYKELLLNNENIETHLTIIKPGILKPKYINNRLITDNGSIILDTQKNISINKYRNLFYKDYKIIDDKIFELNELGLSIWYMDDGTKHKSSYYLNTQNFDLIDQKILLKMLDKNFNIKGSIHKSRDLFNIYIKKESTDVFTNIIKPYICESMKYKLHGSL